jgi:peptidoglycan/xylan/chitin deacetylase (PgdA/CDA1 family)
MKKFIAIILSAVLVVSILVFPTKISATSVDLIENPSVEIGTNGVPANFSTNSWGSNTATFNYTSTGHTGNHGLAVTISNYVSGDAKWMPDKVGVTAGQTYTYSDYSQSDTATELDAAYTNASGNMSFAYLQSTAASSTWQQSTATFTVPAGAVSVSVYHILTTNGTLQTDDFSLVDQSTATPPASSTNLLANASFEITSGSDPANWSRGGWGTNTAALTYVSGAAHSGTHSVRIDVTSYTNGDAKWYADPVTVTSGTAYTYQDYYSSNIATNVVVAMTNANGIVSYMSLANAPASSPWSLYSADFVVPSGVQSLAVYHSVDSIGTLTIDDTSLVVKAATTNYIQNPSFENVASITPANWTTDSWGSNTASFQYIKDDAHTGTASAKVTITGYNSGDAKWASAPMNNLISGNQYNLSAWYKVSANTQPRVVASYIDRNGTQQYLALPNPLPASDASTTWQHYSSTLYVPNGATSISILFLISSNGWLQTDDFSLTAYTPVGFSAPLISITFDDGWSSIYTNGLPLLKKYGLVSTQYLISGKLNTANYMTTAQAQAFFNAGSEIGSHTITHPDLTTLTSGQLTTELGGSQSALQQLFGANVAKDFATPYGTYDPMVLSAVHQYYQSHRSTDVGYNSKDTFNPYDILVQDIEPNTIPSEVAAWVAKAKADNTWLVLVFHQVSNTTDPSNYAVSPANLNTELSNIAQSGVSVETISQALVSINSQL